MTSHLAYISDQVYYWDGCAWYTSNGFPLTELVESTGCAISKWSFYGRIEFVDCAPPGTLRLRYPAGTEVVFIGPRLTNRGIAGYLRSLPEYLRSLRVCIKSHDVLWVKANFVTAWLALPFLRSSALVISHQVGDPAQISVGPSLLRPFIRAGAAVMTRLVHRAASVNAFVSNALAMKYGCKGRVPLICNESRLNDGQFIHSSAVRMELHHPIRLLYVGRLSPEKGLPILLHAVAKLGREYQLNIVGSGPQQGQLEVLAAALNVSDRIHFCGSVSWGQGLFAVMRESDILVLPSHTEGLPLVLLEGMSQGLPIVASAVGGVPEIVHDQITGMLFPQGNARILADAVAKVASDASLRAKLIWGGLEVAKKNTLNNQLCKMFASVFARLGRVNG